MVEGRRGRSGALTVCAFALSWSGCSFAALPLVVLPVASAIYGYSRTGACVEAYETRKIAVPDAR
jgi:hypothetical protein